jgi:hypothetical protein
MGRDDDYGLWERDASILPAIGQLIAGQPTEIEIRLPREMAEQAIAIWKRDGSEGAIENESPAQWKIRHRAASVSLIGLSIESTGRAEGDEVVFTTDAWFVGHALDAADEAGLLNS